jgi:hypothetical protein
LTTHPIFCNVKIHSISAYDGTKIACPYELSYLIKISKYLQLSIAAAICPILSNIQESELMLAQG